MQDGQMRQSGWQRFASEIGSELKRLGRLGSYEMGAALQAFPPGESAYRGDIGMLSAGQGSPAHVPQPEQTQRPVQSL